MRRVFARMARNGRRRFVELGCHPVDGVGDVCRGLVGIGEVPRPKWAAVSSSRRRSGHGRSSPSRKYVIARWLLETSRSANIAISAGSYRASVEAVSPARRSTGGSGWRASSPHAAYHPACGASRSPRHPRTCVAGRPRTAVMAQLIRTLTRSEPKSSLCSSLADIGDEARRAGGHAGDAPAVAG
jgi:hypothetical protein